MPKCPQRGGILYTMLQDISEVHTRVSHHDVGCSQERHGTGNDCWERTRCKCFDEHIQLYSLRARASETDLTLDAL
eukprot:2573651-Rhodomonas_salina.1